MTAINAIAFDAVWRNPLVPFATTMRYQLDGILFGHVPKKREYIPFTFSGQICFTLMGQHGSGLAEQAAHWVQFEQPQHATESFYHTTVVYCDRSYHSSINRPS